MSSVVGRSLRFVVCWLLLDAGSCVYGCLKCALFLGGCRLLVVACSLMVDCCLMFVVLWQLCVVGCRMLMFGREVLIVCCLMLAACWSVCVDSWLVVIYCLFFCFGLLAVVNC